jgi:acyl carrier protein
MSIEQQLRDHILKNFMYSGDGNELTNELELFESGIVDSTGVLELVAFIEETFSARVDDSELLPENFATVAAMAAFIRTKVPEMAG